MTSKSVAKAFTTTRLTACPRRLYSKAGNYRVAKPFNEKNYDYVKGSPERQKLITAIGNIRSRLPVKVPAIGTYELEGLKPEKAKSMPMPSEHRTAFAEYTPATKADVSRAIETALEARQAWREMSFDDRAAIFLRAADLVSTKYRYELMAATMLGQGKNAWQAEIDAAAELADFFRFNVGYAQEIYDKQPALNSDGHHGRTDWRPLEGFVYAVSPFNFTAIGGNLVSAAALMGNVVVWKPAEMTVFPSYLVYRILLEAGLPPAVVQLVNGDAELVTDVVYEHPEFSALSFIGSSQVFRSLYARASKGVGEGKYRDFPRMVGETSGKNFHLLHPSADVENAVKHTIRASFEYAGQKCSACSRIYIPQSQASAFFDIMRKELGELKVGNPEDFENFTGPVINKAAFDRLSTAIDAANKDDGLETIVGGSYDGASGYYVTPTIYRATSPTHWLFDKELFGPVLVAYVYPDAEFDQVLNNIDEHGGGFALTGAIFATDQSAIREAENKLRFAAGNFYINCKTTGAVIGQQSFGGSRSSGTCDKAGSTGFLTRFTAPRTLKEEYNRLESVQYPSNF